MMEHGLGIQGFPYQEVWDSKTPMKVNFFLWLAMRGRILTQENLKRRRFQLASKCLFCGENEETVMHLLIDCKEVEKLWYYFYGVIGIQWRRGQDLGSVLKCRGHSSLTAAGKVYWRVMKQALMWNVWLERNTRLFEDEEHAMWMLIDRVKETMWKWSLNEEGVKGIRLEQMMFHFASLVRD